MRRTPNSRRRAKCLDELRLDDSYGKKVLSTHAPKLIPVIEKEAHRFCSNAVVVGKTVVHNSRYPGLAESLKAAGLRQH